jgi:hypothetical protein
MAGRLEPLAPLRPLHRGSGDFTDFRDQALMSVVSRRVGHEMPADSRGQANRDAHDADLVIGDVDAWLQEDTDATVDEFIAREKDEDAKQQAWLRDQAFVELSDDATEWRLPGN